MMNFFYVIGTVQNLIVFLLVSVVVVLSAFCLVHALTTPNQGFVIEGKRSRKFWALLNGLALVVSFLALTPTGPVGLFGALLALIIPGIYLADVRPAVSSYRRRRGGPSQRPPTPW